MRLSSISAHARCANAQWPLSGSAGLDALARCSAGQRRHIKPGKLHQGNKMAIK